MPASSTLTYGELFAGVSGMGLGFQRAGWVPRWFVESNHNCQQILKLHHRELPIYGDVRDVRGSQLERVDVIGFGFPCQDLSSGGNRAGLDGDRSGLFFQAIRIIGEMQNVGRGPSWLVIENVRGLLTADDGTAMGRCLNELGNLGALVVEWGMLDAQFFGVPQRRKRIYIVACLDPALAGGCPDPLLPLAPGGAGNPAEGGDDRSADAPRASRSAGGDRFFVKARRSKFPGDLELWDDGAVAPTLTTHDNGSESRVTMLVTSPVVAFSADQHHMQARPETFPTLRSSSKSGAAVLHAGKVRRISPDECEALQGWPAGYTAYGLDQWGRRQPIADTPRYKMIGNGVAAPCAEWVARQIQKVHDAPGEQANPTTPPPFDVAFPDAISRVPVKQGGHLPAHPEWAMRSVFFDTERCKWRAKYRMHGKNTVRTFTDEDSARTWLQAEAERHGAPSQVTMGHAAP